MEERGHSGALNRKRDEGGVKGEEDSERHFWISAETFATFLEQTSHPYYQNEE